MRLLLALLASTLPIACGEATPTDGDSWVAGYVCEDGKYFRLEVQGRRARVTAASGSHLLRQAPSPRGQAYTSDDALLILEDDLAQFRGLPEGLYQNCRQMRVHRGGPR